MKRILFICASMTTLSGAAACDSDDDPLASYRETCRAETRVFKADYTVSPGKLHMVVNGQLQELKGTSAKGEQPAYGIWHLPDWTPPGGDLIKERIYEHVEIDSGRFTVTRMCNGKWSVLSASTSSPATVTATTIEVHEAHYEETEWTMRNGDRTIGTGSVGLAAD